MTTLIRFRKDGAQFGESKQRHSSRNAALITLETREILNSIK